MNRRHFLSLLGATALVPFVAKAAPVSRWPTVGDLTPAVVDDVLPFIEGFSQTIVKTMFYGDASVMPMQFVGISDVFNGGCVPPGTEFELEPVAYWTQHDGTVRTVTRGEMYLAPGVT